MQSSITDHASCEYQTEDLFVRSSLVMETVLPPPSLVVRSDVVLNVVSTPVKLAFVLSKLEATERASVNERFHRHSIVSPVPFVIEPFDPYSHHQPVAVVAMASSAQCWPTPTIVIDCNNPVFDLPDYSEWNEAFHIGDRCPARRNSNEIHGVRDEKSSIPPKF